MARAASTGINAFTMVATLTVSQSGTTEILVPASRAQSLVISEYHYPSSLNLSGTCCYSVGGFIELYNNADTTIYLDGKVIGRAFSIFSDFAVRPCSLLEPLRVDALGLWSFMFEKFPGSGTQFPLAPGQTVVAATDAIDHRPFALDALDLSSADFEFRGPSDVNNPAVPDMVNQGPMQPPDGHGFNVPGGSDFIFLSQPVNPAVLPRMREPNTTLEYLRIPADHVLESFVPGNRNPTGLPPCEPMTHPKFNRGSARPSADRNGSLHRKVLYTRTDGRVVLQHTRNSESDWYGGARSPGSVVAQRQGNW